jgi:hypothetical protein
MPRRLTSSTLCPHCWHRFRPDETLWIAAHPDLLGDRLLSPEDPVRFLPSRFTPLREAIDPEGARTRRLACPRCHLEVPQMLLERSMRIFSIVGTPSSGKSYFIVSAAWKLREDLARRFCVALTDTDPAMNRSITDNEARLFLNQDASARVFIDKTELQGSQYNSVQFDPGISTLLARPHIFTMRPTRDHVNGAAPDRAAQLLTLYDNAGEHFFPGADTFRAPGTRHLAHADALLFVFDPTQDVRFRQRLGSSSADPQMDPGARVQARQDQLITEMASRIRMHRGVSPQERIRKPLFVILSKSDVWGHLIVDDAGAPVDITTPPYEQSRPGVGKVLLGRVDRVSALVRALLLELAPDVVTAAEDAFERVIYVPVSATGTSPELDPATNLLKVPVSKIAPRWVAVPFLYAFARWSEYLFEHDRNDLPADQGEPAPVVEAPGG